MKRRDLVLGIVSGIAYFGYGSMTQSLPMQVQAVFLLAVFGISAAILEISGKNVSE